MSDTLTAPAPTTVQCAWDGSTDDVLAAKYAGKATMLCKGCRLTLAHAAFYAIVGTAK